MPDSPRTVGRFWCVPSWSPCSGDVAPGETGRFSEPTGRRPEHVFPDGQHRRPSRATVWRKWKNNTAKAGFEACFRKAAASDRGQPRKATPAMIAKGCRVEDGAAVPLRT